MTKNLYLLSKNVILNMTYLLNWQTTEASPTHLVLKKIHFRLNICF